ncbi:MAG: alkaline phosphatase [Acidobacteria bacterium]|nr:alkaline phosphatase [Acidobacteriota bacterium]
MKVNRRQLTRTALLAAAPLQAQQEPSPITHGPFLGHVETDAISIWARTRRAGSFRVLYGKSPSQLDRASAAAATSLDHDNAAWLRIGGLEPGTRYHYRIEGDARPGQTGSFMTVPSADQYRDAETNPRGLFNFSFQFGSCANQNTPQAGGVMLPAYRTMYRQHASRSLFTIMNGDWVYEEKRDYPVDQWRSQTGCAENATPAIAQWAPSIAGVWENYKLYLERGKNMAVWHRDVPGYFTPDDHEILNDVYGTGSAGVRTQQAVFRDIGLRGWYDYIAGSNPLATKQNVVFGRCAMKAGSDLLRDPNADFSSLNLAEASNLHIHWGGQLAGVPPGRTQPPGDPNAGVYEIAAVVDRHTLRIRPALREDAVSSYSIGRHNYASFQVGNVAFYLLDTRGTRDMHDIERPDRPGLKMLGKTQHEWLKNSMAASTADFFFLASSVNLMIPHVGAPGSTDPIEGKDDAWTAFLEEREELIRFWDGLGKPVFIMTGDLHNSFAIKVTDRVWEFGAGPHNSQNHPAVSEGGRPANGPFDSRGRPCEIRWSSYIRNDVPAALRRWPIYAMATINNVFPNPREPGRMRWVAYPKPHVVVQYFDGITGDLLYAEPIHAAPASNR